jgi:hypothetical protein
MGWWQVHDICRFTGTKVPILYWYKSTNTDAAKYMGWWQVHDICNSGVWKVFFWEMAWPSLSWHQSRVGIHAKITCFTGTKVPILTLTRLAGVAYITKVQILTLTRLLVQEYNYWRELVWQVSRVLRYLQEARSRASQALLESLNRALIEP